MKSQLIQWSFLKPKNRTADAKAAWILQKSIAALDSKREHCEAIMQELDAPLAKLMFMDSASVIQECIEIIRETAHVYGVSLN